MTYESDLPFAIRFTELIDGVPVMIDKSLDCARLTFPNGSMSIQHDDGRVTNFHADGSMDVIDPEERHYVHHSAEELAVDAIEIESTLRNVLPHNNPEQ